MSQPPAACRFGRDTTVRWSSRAGEYILRVATHSFLASDRESSWTIQDLWQMRDGDFVTITNRWADLPAWFKLHPVEVADTAAFEMMKQLNAGYKPTEPLNSANVWRVKAGDRLVWVATSDSSPVKGILDFSHCALVLGENSTVSWDGMASFGAPDGAELTPAAALATRTGFRAAVAVGMPREFSEDWRFGA